MDTFIGVIVVIVYILIALAFCYWCAKIAIRKGRSPLLWAILGFVIPLIALIIVAVLPASDGPPADL